MINRSDYTDEEWAEVLARCKLLTEEHEWQEGDWGLIGDDPFILVQETEDGRIWIKTESGIFKRPHMRESWGGHLTPELIRENAIWIPRLDQLVRMDGWLGAFFHLQNLSSSPGWGVWDIIEKEWTSDIVPTPELAVLRTLQFCEQLCSHMFMSDKPRPNKRCAGIHLPDGLHNCLDHYHQGWLKV